MFKKFTALVFSFLLCFSSYASASKLKFGYKPTPPEKAQKYLYRPSPRLKAYSLPTSVDLCNQLPPVGDQGYQGSCVAWAVGYYYKSFQECKEHGWDCANSSEICSPAFVYNQINGGEDRGSYPIDAFRLIVREGCDNLQDMPYDDSDYLTLPTKDQMINALNWRGESFGFFFTFDNNYTGARNTPLTDDVIYDMKQHLANGDVFMIAIPVYTNFEYLDSTNYFYDGPGDGDDYLGGHAIIVCGYDDDAGDGAGGFKIRNSWGTTWGNNGEAYLSYNFVKNYAFEAAYMTDRIGYQWKRIVDLDIDELERGNLNATVSNGTDEITLMGDYLFQSISGDTRKGVHAVFDITDLGIPESYILSLQNMGDSGSDGTLTSLLLKDSDNRTYVYPETPVSIPSDGTVVRLNIDYKVPEILNFTVSPDRGYPPLTTNFTYEVSDFDSDNLTCYFDFNGDNSTDEIVENCLNGTVSYTYENYGTYNVSFTVSDGENSVSITRNVYVDNPPPEIKVFEISPDRGYVPLQVNATVSVYDLLDDTLTCYLDFDEDNKYDEVVDNCTNATLSYTYNRAGEFRVTLAVSDGYTTVRSSKSVSIKYLKKLPETKLGEVTLEVGSGVVSDFSEVNNVSVQGYDVITALRFRVENATSSVPVVITFQKPLPANVRILKRNRDITSQVKIAGDTIAYTIVDNGLLDENSSPGIVDDPLIIATPSSQPSGSSSGGGGGGCSLIAEMPSAAGLLNLFVVGLPLFYLRRKRHN